MCLTISTLVLVETYMSEEETSRSRDQFSFDEEQMNLNHYCVGLIYQPAVG